MLQKLHFETVHSGVLTATRVGSLIEMELPLNPPDKSNYSGALFPIPFQSARQTDRTCEVDLLCIELRLTFLSGCLKGDPSIRSLASAAVGGEELMPKVVEVQLNPVTKKLVVRMEDGFGRAGIEGLRVMEKDEALAIDTGEPGCGITQPLHYSKAHIAF